jgi:hypothetical protein
LTGTLSCSGRGCHADFERPDMKDQPISRISYTRWLLNDPHTRAYQVLYDPLARQMGEKLGIKNVATEPRCLACHCTPQAAALDTVTAREERIFGVGCEACHGPAKDWLVAHRDESLKKMDPEKKKLAFRDIKMTFLQSHSVRAEVCAGCHIGAPADPEKGLPLRDMNHDFIAAGHPRLTFEYGSFLANLPKHWTEKDTRSTDWKEKVPDLEARAWIVGQAVSAQAALRLLAEHRANPKAKDRVWPELAEYDCYACHHDLEGRSWRQERGYPNGLIGALRPSRWYTALLPAITTAMPGDPALPLDGLTKTLARALHNEDAVAKEADAVLAGLKQFPVHLDNREYKPDDIKGLRQKLLELMNGKKRSGWDQVEQCALGLRALDLAAGAWRKKEDRKPSQQEEDFSRAIGELLKELAFPSMKASQKGGPGEITHVESPLNFRRTEKDEKELDKIIARLKQGG